MKAGLMKLTALSVVLGVGLLAVMQARRSTPESSTAQTALDAANLGAAETDAVDEAPPAGNSEPSLVDDAEELLDEAVSVQQKTAGAKTPRRPTRLATPSAPSAPSADSDDSDDEFDRLLTAAANAPPAKTRGATRATSLAADWDDDEPAPTQARAVTRVGVSPKSRAPAADALDDGTTDETDTVAGATPDADLDDFDTESATSPPRRAVPGLTAGTSSRAGRRLAEQDEPADRSAASDDPPADEDDTDAGFSGRPLRGRPQLSRGTPAPSRESDEFADEQDEPATKSPTRPRGNTRRSLDEDDVVATEPADVPTEDELTETTLSPPALRGRPRLSSGASPRSRVVTVAADEEQEPAEPTTTAVSELEDTDEGFAPRTRGSAGGRPRSTTRFEDEDELDADPVPAPREAAPMEDDGPTGALADEDFPAADDTATPPGGGTAPAAGAGDDPGADEPAGGAAAGETTGETTEPAGGATAGEPEEDQPRPRLDDEEDPLPGGGGRPGGKSPTTGVEELEAEEATPAPVRAAPPATPAGPAAPATRPGTPAGVPDEDEPLANQRRNGSATGNAPAGSSTKGNGLATPDVGEVPPATGGVSRKPRPKLSIEKRAPDTAVLGRPMVYEIVVKNSGLVAAQGVTVEDVVPSGLQIEATKPQAQLEGRRLSWRLGTLEPGASETIAVRVIPLSEGTVGGVATVHFDNQREGTSSTGPRLQVNVDAPRKATVGQTVSVTFKIRNLGPTLATGVLIHNVLPAGLKHPAGDDLEFEIGDLPPGGAREVTLQLQAAQAGTAVNRSIVTADGAVSEETVTQLDVVGAAIDVARTGTRRLNPGKKGRFVNTVTNPTTSPLARVTLTETVPAGLEFVEAGDGGRYDEARRTVTWDVGTLGPREARSVSLSLATAGRGSQISVVRASDPSGASGETVGTLQVVGTPALSIEAPDLPGAIDAGQEAQATYRIYNRGTDAALNTRVVLSIPGNLEVVGVDGPVKHQAAAVGGARQRTEIRLEPIRSIDVKKFAEVRLTLRGRAGGGGRVKVQAACDQAADPILREDDLQVIAE